MQTKAAVVLVALGVAFGSAFLFVKVIVDEIAATELVAGRLALGATATLTLLLILGRSLQFTRSAIVGATVLAVLDSIIPFTLIAWAESRIDSGVASVVVSLMPMFTVLFAALVLPDERLAPGGFFGLGAGFLGVIVLAGPEVADVSSSHTLGILAVIGAAMSYGLAAVVARHLLCSEDALELTSLKLGIGAALAFAMTFALEGMPDYGGMSPRGALALLALGVLSTSVAFAAFLWVVRQVGSVKASLTTYIIPVAGLFFGWLVLGESVGLNTVLGALLIGAGVSAVMHVPRRSGSSNAPLGCPTPVFKARDRQLDQSTCGV